MYIKNGSYSSIHSWIRHNYGAAKHKICACGNKARDWALKKGFKYDYDIDCFEAMCRGCHNKYDDKFVPPPFKGEKHHQSKLTEIQAVEIIKRINEGESNSNISKDYPVTFSTVSKIRNKKQWTHL